ncbi:MAG: transglycosylase domain-containing protein [Clostridiales bacterium]|nr:transglycosylase domain-containing protein [Clostridiales bacterium]
MKKIISCVKYLVFLMLAVIVCSGFCIVNEGYQIYREAVAEVSLEEKIGEIRSKDTYTDYEDLPETYVNAIVAVEDHRFYDHNGIDLIAICRAVIHDIQAGSFVEGGSTIPQQLAKNLYFSQEKELTRKVAEVFVALDLKQEYTDEEILELYVNSIYFGDVYYDVASACEGYFDKEPSEMTDYECTLLAGIPNAPSVYAPTKNPDLAAKRQMVVISRMQTCGYLEEEEAVGVAETAAQVAYAD